MEQILSVRDVSINVVDVSINVIYAAHHETGVYADSVVWTRTSLLLVEETRLTAKRQSKYIFVILSSRLFSSLSASFPRSLCCFYSVSSAAALPGGVGRQHCALVELPCSGAVYLVSGTKREGACKPGFQWGGEVTAETRRQELVAPGWV
ncbi:UNVERIFIED_CONTAM: hypothetical protein K2H54_077296 [Gekko kuhli]